MAEQGKWSPQNIFYLLAICLVLYNIGSGLIVKKIGIPGIAEFSFEKESPPSPPERAPSPTAPPQQTVVGQSSPTQQEQPVPGHGDDTSPGQTPASTPGQSPAFVQPPTLPDHTCPSIAGMFWMSMPNTWYGPFNGFAISWQSGGGFFIWNPYASGVVPFPDPYAQVQRNTWIRLTGTPFNICVDSTAGRVFGQYSP